MSRTEPVHSTDTEPRIITPDGATDTEIIADAIAAFCRIAEEVRRTATTERDAAGKRAKQQQASA